jgi:hypothetical protein
MEGFSMIDGLSLSGFKLLKTYESRTRQDLDEAIYDFGFTS